MALLLDGDGKITKDELATIMGTIGKKPTETELGDIINEFDTDGNGAIEFDEFLAMAGRSVDGGPDELREAFRVFDKNGDGLITADELKTVMKDLGR
jgi:calmodulin